MQRGAGVVALYLGEQVVVEGDQIRQALEVLLINGRILPRLAGALQLVGQVSHTRLGFGANLAKKRLPWPVRSGWRLTRQALDAEEDQTVDAYKAVMAEGSEMDHDGYLLLCARLGGFLGGFG